MIGPPADREYPVEPVGVAMISPSAGYVSVIWPEMAKLR